MIFPVTCKCKTCHGVGTVEETVDICWSGYTEVLNVSCDDCEGTGQIEIEEDDDNTD